MGNTLILENIRKELPPMIARKEVSRLTGGLISPRHLANLDSAGLGPKGKVRVGRLVGYEKESFIEWLSDRMKTEDIAMINGRAKDR